MKQIRPTTGGIALLVGIVVLAIAGALASYRELLLLSFVGFLLLVLAFVMPRFASTVEVSRRLTRVLVQRGDMVDMKLTIKADRAVPTLAMTDQVGTARVSFEVPALVADEQREVIYQVRAEHRGVHRVGPLQEDRRDPFDLTERTTNHDVIDEVMVHPVVHKLGRSESASLLLQRNTPFRSITDDPSSEFRTLREYQPGDDPRLIHWASSARTGNLVIRDFLDLRRLARVIALETSEAVLSASEFEEAAEIGCSLACQALESGLVTIVRSTDPDGPAAWAPLKSRTDILTAFAQVHRSPAATTRNDRLTSIGGLPSGQIYLITGARSPVLPRLLGGHEMRSKLVVVRISSQPARLPRLPVASIDVRSGVEFARKWRRGDAA
jgi:uncharacterized protein (DUF58 family)